MLYNHKQEVILQEVDLQLTAVLLFFGIYPAIPLDFIVQGWYLFEG